MIIDEFINLPIFEDRNSKEDYVGKRYQLKKMMVQKQLDSFKKQNKKAGLILYMVCNKCNKNNVTDYELKHVAFRY